MLHLMYQNMRNEAEKKANDEDRRARTDPSLRSLRKSKVQHCSLCFLRLVVLVLV